MTEGIDGFAVVVVSFLQPTLISADTFAELSVVTQGDTAEGKPSRTPYEP